MYRTYVYLYQQLLGCGSVTTHAHTKEPYK